MAMAANPVAPQEPALARTATIEQRIRLMLGDLMVNNTALVMQLEECQREIAELKEKLPPEKPAKAA